MSLFLAEYAFIKSSELRFGSRFMIYYRYKKDVLVA